MRKEQFIAWVLPLVACLTAFNQAEAKDFDDQVKETIDTVSSYLKKEVDLMGDDHFTIQSYLENYQWKGIIQPQATSGAETLRNLKLNGHHRIVTVHKGEVIHGEVDCYLDPSKASLHHIYRVCLGIHGEGVQTTIGTTLGIAAGERHESFTLIAPMNPGFYQIRFRTADQYLEKNALVNWRDDQGNEPDGTTTIGIIYVKSP